MKKTFLTAALVLTLLFSMVLPALAAPPAGSLSATGALLPDGTSFTVTLSIKDNPGIIAIKAQLIYDSEVFRLKDATNGEIFESIFVPSEKTTDNPYNIIWMDATAAEDNTTNGALVTYTFETLKDASVDESEIKFDIVDAANMAQDKAIKIEGCTFKVNVKGNSANAAADASDNAANDGMLTVETPLTDNTTVSDETASSDETTENDKTSDNANEDLEENDNSAVKTILIIAIVVVLGLAVTFTAIYFKKKSQNQNTAE